MFALHLSEEGKRIVSRGGGEADDDAMVIMELMNRAPGLTLPEYQELFVALRMECGGDALYALRNGHVTFVERKDTE